jgi:hypothetical protein
MIKRMVLTIAPLMPFMNSHATINSMVIRDIVMNVKLRVCRISTLKGKDRASLMNKLSMQDKRVGATTILINRRISCFATATEVMARELL